MKLTQKEYVLMKLLNCGYGDLGMLEDINYDLDDIIDDLVTNDCLSLNNIFKAVFAKGVSDLEDVLNNEKENMLEEMNHQIKTWKEEDISYNEDISLLDVDEDYQQLLKDKELLKGDNLKPTEQWEGWYNCQDTSVSIMYLEWYNIWLSSEICNIENDMGFNFQDKTW